MSRASGQLGWTPGARLVQIFSPSNFNKSKLHDRLVVVSLFLCSVAPIAQLYLGDPGAQLDLTAVQAVLALSCVSLYLVQSSSHPEGPVMGFYSSWPPAAGILL